MPARDAAEYNEASYEVDPSAGCDTLADHIAELVKEECPSVNDRRTMKSLQSICTAVTTRLLDEGRLGPLVDVKRLQGRDLIAALIGEIIEAPDARLMAQCIDFVMELGVQLGISETKIAQLAGVNKATVSRYCVHLKMHYRGGRPAAGMKPNKAVQSYRDTRTGRSSRGPRSARRAPWRGGRVPRHRDGRSLPQAPAR